MDRTHLGPRAEEEAEQYLRSTGYTILDRNFRAHNTGELDIVALSGATLVIVEVKARDTDGFNPLEALTKTKINRIIRATAVYLSRVRVRYDYIRFDVISIHHGKLEHLKDAFYGKWH